MSEATERIFAEFRERLAAALGPKWQVEHGKDGEGVIRRPAYVVTQQLGGVRRRGIYVQPELVLRAGPARGNSPSRWVVDVVGQLGHLVPPHLAHRVDLASFGEGQHRMRTRAHRGGAELLAQPVMQRLLADYEVAAEQVTRRVEQLCRRMGRREVLTRELAHLLGSRPSKTEGRAVWSPLDGPGAAWFVVQPDAATVRVSAMVVPAVAVEFARILAQHRAGSNGMSEFDSLVYDSGDGDPDHTKG